MAEPVRISQNDKTVAVHQTVTQVFSGPLPHPEVLERYNNIVPGAAERILAMTEKQFSHRVLSEEKVINSNILRSKLGQILGFIISIFGLIVAGIIALFASPTAGSIVGVGTLASLVSVFMYGSRTRESELANKKESES